MDKLPNNKFDKYWKDTSFTEINSIKEFENSNLSKASDKAVNKIYQYFKEN